MNKKQRKQYKRDRAAIDRLVADITAIAEPLTPAQLAQALNNVVVKLKLLPPFMSREDGQRIVDGICPNCGGELVRENGGPFGMVKSCVPCDRVYTGIPL